MAWEVQYEANELPGDATPAWDEWDSVGSPTVEISPAGYLHIDAPGAAYVAYSQEDANLDESVGITVEANIKAVAVAGWGSLYISVSGKTYWFEVYFYADKVILDGDYIAEAAQEYEIDLTDDYHAIRITIVGSTINVYVDGVLRLTGTANYEDAYGVITFGGYTAGNAEYYFDYVYYRVDGAYAPGEGETVSSVYGDEGFVG